MRHFEESVQRVQDVGSLPRWVKQLVVDMQQEISSLRAVANERQPSGPVFQDDCLLPEPHFLIPDVDVVFALGEDITSHWSRITARRTERNGRAGLTLMGGQTLALHPSSSNVVDIYLSR